MFIVIEGQEGVGKKELMARLPAMLRERGLTVVEREEPTKDLEHGMRFRAMLASGQRPSARVEAEMIMDDRRDNLRTFVRPALKKGHCVVQLRYFYSTAAYQGSSGLNAEDLLRENRTFAPEPDVLIYLERDMACDKANRKERDRVKHVFESCVADAAMRELCQVIRVDTTTLTPDEVAAAVIDKLEPLLINQLA